jgi:hypothetical protein
MSTRHFTLAASTLALLLATGCESTSSTKASTKPTTPPAPVEISNEVTATAAVTAVDASTRIVTLRREDGSMFQVMCGPEVRNFDQIAAGDTLKVKFKESIRASMAGSGGPDAGAGVIAARAPQGGQPGAAVGVGASVRVKIESIDKERDIVVFSLPSGELISHRIATPEGKVFVNGLHVGDRVQLDYAQAVAITVDKG